MDSEKDRAVRLSALAQAINLDDELSAHVDHVDVTVIVHRNPDVTPFTMTVRCSECHR